jgi:hypothetical protein
MDAMEKLREVIKQARKLLKSNADLVLRKRFDYTELSIVALSHAEILLFVLLLFFCGD